MKEQTAFTRTIHILNPALIYCIVYNACYLLLAGMMQVVSGHGEQTQLWIEQNSAMMTNLVHLCSMLIGAGCLLPIFRREEAARRTAQAEQPGMAGAKLLWVKSGILAVTGAVGLNILFSLLHLTEMSVSYEQTAQVQYQLPFLLGLFLYGLCSPLAEELLFRGLIYNRMKQYFSVRTALLVSSIFFGIYHGNLVQAVYGTLIGLLIAYLYERTGRFGTAVFVHGVANAAVFACTYDASVGETIGTPLNCAVFLTIFGIVFWNTRKNVADSK